jgi:DNA-directed RNA polymerase specialized sigma24 family protein
MLSLQEIAHIRNTTVDEIQNLLIKAKETLKKSLISRYPLL